MPRIAGRGRYLLATTAYLGFVATAAPASAGITGGASGSPPPKLTAVKCKSVCYGPTGVRAGSVVVLRGKRLGAVKTVTFLGRRSGRDDTTVRPDSASGRRITVRVPRAATSGPLTVTDVDGQLAEAPTRSRIRVERVTTRRVAGTGGGPGFEIAITGRKVFFGGERRPSVTFVILGDQPVHAVVQVVSASDGAVVASYDQGAVAPGETRVVSWNGLIEGVAAKDGRYEFRVTAQDGRGAVATSSQADSPEPSPESFVLIGHKFPVRGRHDYGEYAASFGGGRGHKGHDVFAKCGTPLVAARGGVVKIRRHQSRAGHYVVIDGERTGVDYVYMHLRRKALVAKGDRVHTGELIGYVGDTGRAHGCHLHFEMWSSPGWYTGGSPFDPLPHLKAWDKVS